MPPPRLFIAVLALAFVSSAPAADLVFPADLFAADDTPLPDRLDPADLAPHPLIIQRVLPVIAEQTWRLDHAALDDDARATALAVRAQARADLRQFTAAADDLAAAIELAPTRADLRRQRAWLHGGMGDFASADADLAAAFRLEPDSTHTARVQGLLRIEQGNYAAAAAALDFHLEDQPLLPSFSVLAALARRRAGITAGDDEFILLADRGTYLEPWPQAIAAFHAGRLARPDLLAFARGDNADPAPVRACQAWFHLGQRALLDGDSARATHDFHAALRTGGTSAREFRLALAELEHLNDHRSVSQP